MTFLRALPLLALCATATSAAVLPLKPGTYVLKDSPCRDPALAAMFSYDGHRFSYPHASGCRSVTLAQNGRRYRVRETCHAAGDGTPEAPSRTDTTYEIQSATQVSVVGRSRDAALAYRWCPADQAPQPAAPIDRRTPR